MMSITLPETATFARALQTLFQDIQENHGKVLIPRDFVNCIQQTFRNRFDVHDQNDIHEVYLAFIERLNLELKQELDLSKPQTKPFHSKSGIMYERLQRKCDTAWIKTIGKEYSPFTDVVFGQTIVQIVCGNCNYIHQNYEPFASLELIVPQETGSLQKALADAMYIDEPVNESDTTWRCSECKQSVKSQKTTRIWKQPPVLVLYLKRFMVINGRLLKNDTLVDIPEMIETFPISRYSNPHRYKLKATANHKGILGGGHYYAICKNKDDWIVFNDSNANKLNQLNGHYACALFYEEYDLSPK
jgi:ubiquitin C-terminal hydrolase